MKPKLLFLSLIPTITIIACGGTMSSTVHAQQNSTAAILSGHCAASNLPIAFMIGLGATDETCNSNTGSNNTGLPVPSAGTLQNLRALSSSGGAIVTIFINLHQRNGLCHNLYRTRLWLRAGQQILGYNTQRFCDGGRPDRGSSYR